MTALPPLLFIDLPVVTDYTTDGTPTRTVSVRVDRIIAVGDARSIDYDGDLLPPAVPERSRVIVDRDGCYLTAMSRTDVLAMMRQVRIAVDARPEPWEHEGHRPVPHRDGRAPWCEACGWTSPALGRPAVQITARHR